VAYLSPMRPVCPRGRLVAYRPVPARLQYGCSKLARSACRGHHLRASKAQRDPTTQSGPSAYGLREGHKTATRIRSGGCAVFLVRVTPSVDAMVKGAALLILLRGLAGRWRLWTRGQGARRASRCTWPKTR
jgi:hypothetical protein